MGPSCMGAKAAKGTWKAGKGLLQSRPVKYTGKVLKNMSTGNKVLLGGMGLATVGTFGQAGKMLGFGHLTSDAGKTSFRGIRRSAAGMKPLLPKHAHVKERAMLTQEDINAAREFTKEATIRSAANSLWRALTTPGRVMGLSPLQAATTVVGGAAALGLAGSLLDMGGDKLVEHSRKAYRPKQYNAILKHDPSLREEPRARKIFNVVHGASPYAAASPVISSAVVRSILDSPALDERKFKSILDLERAHQDTRSPWRGKSKPAIGGKEALALLGMVS